MKKDTNTSLPMILALCVTGIILANILLAVVSIIGRNITGSAIGIILLIFGIVVAIVAASTYNKLVRYRNKVKESLALIDIHLKLRFDLIPNLVNTVKGYAKHEEKVFEEVVKLRNQAVKLENEEEKLAVANRIVPKIKHILMIAENYPKLKADALFKSLMDELSTVEDKIVASRRIYDSNVNAYNTLIQTFPNNIFAFIFRFEKQEMFKIDAGENLPTVVDFGDKK